LGRFWYQQSYTLMLHLADLGNTRESKSELTCALTHTVPL
jgi:hypothetical protein